MIRWKWKKYSLGIDEMERSDGKTESSKHCTISDTKYNMNSGCANELVPDYEVNFEVEPANESSKHEMSMW